MAARKDKKNQVNLLPQEEFAASTTGRVLAWLLSTFRYLVITTEMVVIAAFISRFYFDSRLSDLNDEIKQKENYIRAYLSFEKQFKSAQQKLSIVENVGSEQNSISKSVEAVIQNLPNDVSLLQVQAFQNGKIQVQASSLSEKSMDQFLINMADGTRFKNTILLQADVKTNTPFINFSLQTIDSEKEIQPEESNN